MAQEEPEVTFEVTPQQCGSAGDCIKVAITGGAEQTLLLSPQQARTLASELIQTVYRTEVKNSLVKGKANAIEPTENNKGVFSLRSHHVA